MREVVIAGACRTAIGTFGGSLKGSPPSSVAPS
jgi:acetyl-CoA acetyltransferase